ncbi:LysM peptidoglycan-binding domain-containing protein [Pelovirga terrestris]|uniref:LysM peptidoglycan-binding domain-containing protein n=1 Tax=Pelovirga terrestris TaxID=2771352 RepID=A0A8J6QS05_9BACT|nr:LysM peptidoglycan-binding domain-containing protein [Pelovirga terrestris]MBD1401348.1 LysM peptidoglycan-binding domain-containing protein [Pelovirga terrestris]
MYRYFYLLFFLVPGLISCQLGSVVPDPVIDVKVKPNRTETDPAQTTVVPSDADPLLVHSILKGHELSSGLSESLDSFLQPQPLLPYVGDFPLSDHPRVMAFLDRYQGRQKSTLTAWLQRSGRYLPKMQLVFASEGLPLDLAYLAMIESGFNVRAYSWAHAAGPWQFIESTGQMYGLKNDWWQDDRLDLEHSTRAAARFLKDLYKRFDGDWYLAVAAYNAGPGRVSQAIRASGSRDFWDLADGGVLRTETIEYVPKLLAALHLARDPQAYGFADLELAEPIDYEVVTVESQTDLEIVAELSGAGYQKIKELNPALKRWSTPPGVKNYQVRVPVGTAEQFKQLYADLPAEQRVRYHRHQIKSGDTLLLLAKRYQIQVDDIIALNNISNPRALQLGRDLILPLREGFTQRPVESLADGYVRSRRRSYTVQSGDSLWSIARRFEVTEKQLRVWNTLGWSNMLRPGQVLLVSQPSSRVAQQAGTSPQPTAEVIYQVEPGDTLWGIGRRFAVNTDQIRQWNDLTREHILRPGQKLTLLVPAGRQG